MVIKRNDSAKALTVYKASAGSGKTFTLTVEYIKLLVQNPGCYKSILAVTFTNKATEEMKTRILGQLYGLWKGLDESRDYMNKVCQALDVSPEFVSVQAGKALHLLLHHYSYFRVETIDAFFQSVLRNLARELDLTANLRIELNDRQVEELAVDRMVEELDETSLVLQWILKYIYANISEDKGWNVIGLIKNFGQTIFRDFYKEESKPLHDKMNEEGFFDRFADLLNRQRTEALDRMKELGESFFDTLDGENLTVGDIAYGSTGVAGFFAKLRNGIFDESIVGKRVGECMEDESKWAKKTHPRRGEIMALASERFIPILRYAVDVRKEQWGKYQSAELALRHLDQLRLLGAIERKVRELNEEANRFLLSDTQTMLHALVKDTDTPFIFEKIGAMLEHIMIDEFQDTSTIQWENFKVLLQECMSHEDSTNLIVGDVKQSIYRWRAGDWKLLNNIEAQFPGNGEQLHIESLKINYRSKRNIVNFNNLFFQEAATFESKNLSEDNTYYADQLVTAYSDVEQKVPDGKGNEGRVEIKLFPSDDYEQQTLDEICDTVEKLLSEGIRQDRIAILVRNNKFIPPIANYLMTHVSGLTVVSNEAFRLDASVAVNALVMAIRLLAHPQDTITRASLIKVYQKYILSNNLYDNDLLLTGNEGLDLLPKEYVNGMKQLVEQPLYELSEKLYAIFRIEKIKGQSAFLCAFYDQIARFTEVNFSDIESFLHEWDVRISAETINSDEMVGIRIMSIHKSKGLEFDNVIIPFCDWKLEQRYVLWCKTETPPYNELPLVPIDFGRKMRETVFEDNYVYEHFQNIVDNLNLLYVAFTRAGHNLFVFGKKDTSASRSELLQEILPQLTQELEGSSLINEASDKTSAMVFGYGTLFAEERMRQKSSENVFLRPSVPIDIEIETFQNKVEFKQSNQSRDFIESGDDKDNQDNYIKVGNLLHKVFSTIHTVDDIDKALLQLEMDGVLYDESLTCEQLTDMLRKRLESPRVADWFSPRWHLFTECTILSFDCATKTMVQRRPDRVMTDGEQMIVVDFKFGHQRDEYLDQVNEYKDLLRQMGYKNVSGYLWFVYSNKIVEV